SRACGLTQCWDRSRNGAGRAWLRAGYRRQECGKSAVADPLHCHVAGLARAPHQEEYIRHRRGGHRQSGRNSHRRQGFDRRHRSPVGHARDWRGRCRAPARLRSSMRCDSHVHIVGPYDRYPQVAERTYLADVATLKQLESVSATRAIRRFVIVQPSFYGTDNSVLLESLDALAGRGRGIVVINPETTSAPMLSSMAGHGVCGLRLNLYSPVREKPPLPEQFSAVAEIAQALKWHIEVIAPLRVLADNAVFLRSSRTPVVIDHYGLHGPSVPDQ